MSPRETNYERENNKDTESWEMTDEWQSIIDNNLEERNDVVVVKNFIEKLLNRSLSSQKQSLKEAIDKEMLEYPVEKGKRLLMPEQIPLYNQGLSRAKKVIENL